MLQILTSRAGEGLENILVRMCAAPGSQVLVVPEQFSHDAERALCRIGGPGACRHREVLSFGRMARRVAEFAGGGAAQVLDAGGRVLLMHAALGEVAGKLRVYRTHSKRPAFLSGLVGALDECKSYQVSPADLWRAGEEISGGQGDKLRDLGLIFEAYDALTSRVAADPRDTLTRLAEKLDSSRWARGRGFWVWGFTDFTPQQGEVLRALLRDGEGVSVALTLDRDGPDPNRIFAPAKATAAWLTRLAESVGTTAAEESLPLNNRPVSESLRHLERALFAAVPDPWEGSCDVALYCAPDPRAEVERAAAEILRLVREENYCFRDIALCARNFEPYTDLVESVFARYGIPLFLSTATDVLQKPILALVTGALDAAAGDYAYDALFRYLKTGLTDLPDDDRDVLENYVLTWNIRGSYWTVEKDWAMHPAGYGQPVTPEDEALLKRLNVLRRRVCAPLEKLRKNRDKTGRGFSMALYQCLEDIGLPARLEERQEFFVQNGELKLAEEYRQLWNILCTALEQCALLLGDAPMDLDVFSRLFALTLSQYQVGTIPVSLDRVTAGDCTRMNGRRYRAMLWLGADSSSVPQAVQKPGPLTDRDRAVLETRNLQLAPRMEEKLGRELTIVYEACAVASDYLWVSWAKTGPEGELTPSFLVENLRIIFPGLVVREGEETLSRLAAPLPALESAGHSTAALEALKSLPQWRPAALRQEAAAHWRRGRLSLNVSKALYGTVAPLSATRLDNLRSCHFQHFLRFGLKAKPRKKAAFQATDYGTFVHAVLETVLREASAAPGGLARLYTDPDKRWEIIEQAAQNYIDETLKGAAEDSGRLRYLFERMKRAIHAVVDSVVAELAVSDFTPSAFELGFGKNGPMPPILGGDELPVAVSGAVDRVDTWLHEGKRYLRVVDYKTGKKKFDFTDLQNGRGLQMLLYLFALEQAGQQVFGPEPIVPAGVLYFPARDPLIDGKRDMPDEEIARQREKELTRRGLVLGEQDVLTAMECTAGTYRYLPVDKKGDFLVTEEQMARLEAMVARSLAKAAEELAQGDIDADPFYRGPEENACRWCDYAAACHFEPSCGDRRRWEPSISAAQFWAALEEEDTDN